MTNSSSERAPGAAPQRAPSVHARFIPREELGSFASWTPGSFGGSAESAHALRAPEPPRPAAPPAPTEAEWLERVEAARREGAQEGYQNGYRDGLVALEGFKQNLAAQGSAQVQAVLVSMEREFDALQPRLAERVARVALELARQVLRHELATHPEVVQGVAAEAVNALVHSAQHVQVQLHPLDLSLVRDGAADALAARPAQLIGNPALQRGDCVIESDVGTLDARVATRWAQATANLAASVPWSAAAEGQSA